MAHEDHAQRACYAALQLRDDTARYATELKRRHGLGFSTRMGLHSGEVIVGKIGDDLRMDYTAQGHSVGLAQRMEALASPDTCYLSHATAARVSGYFELEDLGEFHLKGARNPVHVHRLVDPGPAKTRFDISRARGLTRFVGRDADMATLEVALEQARAGTGQVVGVVAEAGTGKSRLCYEFAEHCRARGMTVDVGQAVAHGRNIPYLPMLQVFRAYYGIEERDDDRPAPAGAARTRRRPRAARRSARARREHGGARRAPRRAGRPAGASLGGGGRGAPGGTLARACVCLGRAQRSRPGALALAARPSAQRGAGGLCGAQSAASRRVEPGAEPGRLARGALRRGVAECLRRGMRAGPALR
ncbi:MAG: AAA family ATPase [Myxococcota bacterium]